MTPTGTRATRTGAACASTWATATTGRSSAGLRERALARADRRRRRRRRRSHRELGDAGAIRFDGGDGDDALVTGPSTPAWLLGGAGADLMALATAAAPSRSYDDHDATGVRVTLDETGERRRRG